MCVRVKHNGSGYEIIFCDYCGNPTGREPEHYEDEYAAFNRVSQLMAEEDLAYYCIKE